MAIGSLEVPEAEAAPNPVETDVVAGGRLVGEAFVVAFSEPAGDFSALPLAAELGSSRCSVPQPPNTAAIARIAKPTPC